MTVGIERLRGNKAWRPERFVVCEVWSRCLLLTADYPSIMPKNLTLQRDGFPIVSFNSVCPSRALGEQFVLIKRHTFGHYVITPFGDLAR